MNRRAMIVSVCVVVLASASAVSWAADVHRGTIVLAGGNKLVIADIDDTHEEFQVADDAKITRDGKPVPLSSLANGDRVAVTAEIRQNKLVATVIEARSPAAAGQQL